MKPSFIIVVFLLAALYPAHRGRADGSRLVLVDKQGRPRIVLDAEIAPKLTLLDESGNSLAEFGIVENGEEFTQAMPGTSYMRLGTGDEYIVLGSERMPKAPSSDSRAERRSALHIVSMDSEAKASPRGTMVRVSAGHDEAEFGVMQMSPFPFPRIVLRTPEDGQTLFQIRDNKGVVSFTPNK